MKPSPNPKSDFCYVDHGLVVAAKLDQVEYDRTTWHYKPIDGKGLALLLPYLRDVRQAMKQAGLDSRWENKEKAGAGDEWAMFMVKTSERALGKLTSRTAPVVDVQTIAKGVYGDGKDVTKCEWCGDDMIRLTALNQHRFCSNTCADKSAAYKASERREYVRPPVVRQVVACAHCGTMFTQKRSDAKFCGVKCRVAHHRNG